jgi:NAD(P)-dependent dehydrogenase (short-subunit alcohol dehydrogenase family)
MSEDQYTFQNPVTRYPVISPPKQDQPEPGLDRDLKPTTDRGEETYRGLGRLTGRKALITGGDSGIGAAVAIAFAREGADVALNYLPSEEPDAQEIAKVIAETGQRVVVLPGDISDSHVAKKLVADAAEALEGLDILVNNAGKQISVERLEDLTDEQWEETFRVNVSAMFWITKAALPLLPAGSSIINTTSVQAYSPSPNLIDYASTKAAINSFTKGLAQQLAPRGIRVNAVAPGPFWTPLQVSDGQPKDKLPTFGQDTPLGRAGQPTELAPAYVYLASAESSYTTGATININGGRPTP